ncbi:LapA family protein [Rickettsiales bacterium]|nr:LapA family protein [Rickettsiales bacterium]
MKFKMSLGLVLLLSVVLFTIQNVAVVEIQFLLWGFSIPRALLIFAVLSIGIIIGWLTKAAFHKHKEND